jgi:hypothetical protein
MQSLSGRRPVHRRTIANTYEVVSGLSWGSYDSNGSLDERETVPKRIGI